MSAHAPERSRGLKLSEEKTRIVHTDEGFDFLGQNVRKYDGKLLIKPSKKSVLSIMENIGRVLKTNKTTPQEVLIRKLNPIIRGWGNYHQHIVAKKVFSKVAYLIWRNLWFWAKRRHSNKGKKWVVQKYYARFGNRSGVFTARDGENSYRLFDINSIPIKLHVKIKGEANPFDPEWEEYFEKRTGFKMSNSLKGKGLLRSLWTTQKGLCPVCNQKITSETGWVNYQIIWKSRGGHDGNSNRVLLHINCHRKVHSHNLSVTKPVFQKKGDQKA